MATGDIKSAYINSDGFSAYITVEGLSTGGVYAFGLGTNNNPSTAKIAFSLTSEGYSNAGVLGTKSRTVYGVPCERPTATGAMRKAYPNQASPDEAVSGSDVVIRVALSEFIYNDDTSITLSVSSGWYTQGGTPSNAVSSLSVTNNSTLDYPRVVGGWGVPQCQLIVGTSLHLEFLAFHKFAEAGNPVACVKFTVTDGTNTVTSTVTSMSISSDSPLAKIIVYQADINVSSLNDNAVLTAKAVAYPWVGDADSILNTDDGVNTFPTPLYTNLTMRLDKVGDHGHTCVDVTNGNDSTGTVYSSQSLAEAGNAYATIAAALTALATYHNTNSGHNDAGGGTIYLKAGTHTLNSANGGTMSQWVTITRASICTKSEVILQPVANNSTFPRRFKIKDITWSSSTFFLGSKNHCVCIENCELNTTGALSVWTFIYGAAINNNGIFANGFLPYGNTLTEWALIRGNSLNNQGRTYATVVIGNKNIGIEQTPSTLVSYLNNNLVYAYNEHGELTTAQRVSLGNRDGHDIAIIQNIIKRYGSQIEPLVGLWPDSSTTRSDNVLVHHNTFVGGRVNFAYNDTNIASHYHLNWSVKNNIFGSWNNKDDTFCSATAGNSQGSWPVGYNVGSTGNLFRQCQGGSGEWLGEFSGIYAKWGSSAIPLSPEYIEDNSADGYNTSGGDYHLTASSPAKDIAHDLILPYDFEGNARTIDNAPGVYRYGAISSYDGTLKRYNGSSWVKSKLQRFDGADFVDTNLKFYDGTWKTVDTTGV